MNVKRDLWKFISFLAFVAAGLSGHYDVLPDALQPYKQWIEFAAFVGGLYQVWRMQPPTKKDEDSVSVIGR